MDAFTQRFRGIIGFFLPRVGPDSDNLSPATSLAHSSAQRSPDHNSASNPDMNRPLVAHPDIPAKPDSPDTYDDSDVDWLPQQVELQSYCPAIYSNIQAYKRKCTKIMQFLDELEQIGTGILVRPQLLHCLSDSIEEIAMSGRLWPSDLAIDQWAEWVRTNNARLMCGCPLNLHLRVRTRSSGQIMACPQSSQT